jgi:hypothetical protein
MSYSPFLEEFCLCLVLSKSQKHLLLFTFASHLKLTQFFHELKMKGFAVQTFVLLFSVNKMHSWLFCRINCHFSIILRIMWKICTSNVLSTLSDVCKDAGMTI